MEENTIVSFDTETTGIDRKTSKIVQLSIYNPTKNKYGNIKFAPVIDEKFRKNLTQYDIWQPDNVDENTPIYRRIEEKASEVHGLTNKSLVGERTFSTVAKNVIDNLVSVDYVLTMNGLFFDRPMLESEARQVSEHLFNEALKIKWLDIYRIHLHFNKRIDTLEDIVNLYGLDDELKDKDFNDNKSKIEICRILLTKLMGYYNNENKTKYKDLTTFIYDVLDLDTKISLDTLPLKIHHKINGNKLSDLYLKYTGKVLENAHDAEADSKAAYEIYEVMKEKYEITDEDAYVITNNTTYVDFINLGMIKNNGTFETPEMVMTFGKFKSKPIEVLFNNAEGISYLNWIQKNDFDIYFKRFLKEQERLFNESKK